MTDRYVDGIHVAVHWVSGIDDAAPQRLWIADVVRAGMIDPDAAAQEIRVAISDHEKTPPYVLDDSYQLLSWGASGAFQKLTARILESVVTEEMKAALEAALRRISAHMHDPQEGIFVPLTREQGEMFSRRLIVEDYMLACATDDLELVADEHDFDNQQWFYRFQRDEWYYEVRIREVAEGMRFARLWRGRGDDAGP